MRMMTMVETKRWRQMEMKKMKKMKMEPAGIVRR
jgi:hypothetical protein